MKKSLLGRLDQAEIIFVVEADRVLAAMRSAEADESRPQLRRTWDGAWHWEEGAEPKVALFRNLCPASSPRNTMPPSTDTPSAGIADASEREQAGEVLTIILDAGYVIGYERDREHSAWGPRFRHTGERPNLRGLWLSTPGLEHSHRDRASRVPMKTVDPVSFVTTQWGLVLRAGTATTPEATAALGELYHAYHQPLVGHMLRSRLAPEDAEDLVQDFFNGLIRRGSFAKLSEGKGRFRTFLLVSLDNFLKDHWRRLSTLKRGSNHPHVRLEDASQFELGEAHSSPASQFLEFDRDWALTMLGRALSRLKDEYERSRQTEVFRELNVEVFFSVIDSKPIEIEDLGDTAIETGSWVATKADGSVAAKGSYMAIWKRQNGQWKISREIWNTHIPDKSE